MPAPNQKATLVCQRLDRAAALVATTGLPRKCFVFGADGAVQAIDATGALLDLTASVSANSVVGPLATETLAANETENPVGAPWVADRAGSVVGMSALLTAAITGGGTTCVVQIARVSGGVATILTNLTLTFTAAGAAQILTATAASGTYTFVADDYLSVAYTTTGITNTPNLVVSFTVRI